jgi:hypothetical protein
MIRIGSDKSRAEAILTSYLSMYFLAKETDKKDWTNDKEMINTLSIQWEPGLRSAPLHAFLSRADVAY